MNDEAKSALKIVSMCFILMATIAICLVCCSCNSITIVNSHGTTSDVVDETQTASPTVSPTISVPVPN